MVGRLVIDPSVLPNERPGSGVANEPKGLCADWAVGEENGEPYVGLAPNEKGAGAADGVHEGTSFLVNGSGDGICRCEGRGVLAKEVSSWDGSGPFL